MYVQHGDGAVTGGRNSTTAISTRREPTDVTTTGAPPEWMPDLHNAELGRGAKPCHSTSTNAATRDRAAVGVSA
jgi:hypothetical protein